MSRLEAEAVAGAHTWISESSAPHGSEERFEDGWFAGARDVAGFLLRIADTAAHAQRGRRHLKCPAARSPSTTGLPCRRGRLSERRRAELDYLEEGGSNWGSGAVPLQRKGRVRCVRTSQG
ncbi:hypothetical protein ACFYRN_44010 [Streptomyces sp. NPDC005227]|uniref:hypothetical protein n=1 Tax=unclassified Streptomyces TaxID=2593676 RepID=UPI00369CC5D9